MDLNQAALNINNSNKSQSSLAIIIQGYCTSVLEQSNVDFSYDQSLSEYQQKINSSLATAQSHASYYLDTLQKQIISNISNIGNYYALHQEVPKSVPENATAKDWLPVIQALLTISQQYESASGQTSSLLSSLSEELSSDTGNFNQIVTDLNTALNGNNGVLNSNREQIAALDTKIAGEEAGIVLSFVGLIGGIISIFIGAIADVVTGGAATGMVVGGAITVCTSLAGEGASIAELVGDMKLKATLLAEDADLQAEVKLAHGISSGYQSLASRVGLAVTAAENMANSWSSLSSDLSSLVSDLNNGIMSADDVRALFLNAADSEIITVSQDVDTIKKQMDGINTVTAGSGQTIFDILPSYS
ncbi:HBL/NHE enterotoxin family protein [Yersinia enterocolitica]|uniref:HBL/NHE enterotoxin family protein n=1 Tax=Yersinia enterocolitica TaxID=630 RepID=UPI001C8E9CEC|nr:HBL/NHE enterotoxin family protein [Yersinia enterocolitica]MBX9495150.1 HBL/NHE enterotoxin family protein [Yersinia enterocolitica]